MYTKSITENWSERRRIADGLASLLTTKRRTAGCANNTISGLLVPVPGVPGWLRLQNSLSPLRHIAIISTKS